MKKCVIFPLFLALGILTGCTLSCFKPKVMESKAENVSQPEFNNLSYNDIVYLVEDMGDGDLRRSSLDFTINFNLKYNNVVINSITINNYNEFVKSNTGYRYSYLNQSYYLNNVNLSFSSLDYDIAFEMYYAFGTSDNSSFDIYVSDVVRKSIPISFSYTSYPTNIIPDGSIFDIDINFYSLYTYYKNLFDKGVNYVEDNLSEFNYYTYQQYIDYGVVKYNEGTAIAHGDGLNFNSFIKTIFHAPVDMFQGAFNWSLPLGVDENGVEQNINMLPLMTFIMTIGIALTIIGLIKKL